MTRRQLDLYAKGKTYELRGGLKQALHDGPTGLSGCSKNNNLHVGSAEMLRVVLVSLKNSISGLRQMRGLLFHTFICCASGNFYNARWTR